VERCLTSPGAYWFQTEISSEKFSPIEFPASIFGIYTVHDMRVRSLPYAESLVRCPTSLTAV